MTRVSAFTHLRWRRTVPAVGSSALDTGSVPLRQETRVSVVHVDVALVFTQKISDPGEFTDSLPESEP